MPATGVPGAVSRHNALNSPHEPGAKPMKGHLYRLTLEHVEDAKGHPQTRPPLALQVRNHDDLYAIVEKIQAKGLFAGEDAAAFAIGLKLFREVMLQYRGSEVFKELDPHMSAFMKALKQL
jgi:hypothetical protein